MKIIIFCLCLFSSNLWAQEEPIKPQPIEKKLELDPKILNEEESKNSDSLFKNMMVMQKKAISKSNRFLFDSNLSFDYSDSPKTMHALNFGIGYSFNEKLELSLRFSPLFLANDRPLFKETSKTSSVTLVANKPKSLMGLNINYQLAYGKDALSFNNILRSETFLRMFYNQIAFESSKSGSQMGIGIGKSFFINKNLGFRFSVSYVYSSFFINDESLSTNAAIIEPGLVLFL